MTEKKKSEGDALQVKVGADSVSLGLEGGSVSRLGNALADLLSPFSETFGAAGDAVGRYRLAKQEAAAAALIRAKELRKDTERESAKVAPKLFGPMIEGASREDLSEENILELWAKVLAFAPEEYDSKFSLFVDVLEKIGPSDAKKFLEFMNGIDHSTFAQLEIREAVSAYYSNRAQLERRANEIRRFLGQGEEKIKEDRSKFEWPEDETDIGFFGHLVWEQWVQGDYISDCLIVESLLIRTGGQADFIGQRVPDGLTVEVLEHTGLLNRRSYSVNMLESNILFEYFEPSQLAFELFSFIRENEGQ